MLIKSVKAARSSQGFQIEQIASTDIAVGAI
jgi:hypothetical protein